jgi:hypothetical protein
MVLVKEADLEGHAAVNHLQRHADYLRDIRLLKINPGGVIWRVLTLTPAGQAYVQPELAEFGQAPILPAVVRSIETQITVSSMPEPKKVGMIHDLRRAIAEKAPELIAKVMVEIGSKILGS